MPDMRLVNKGRGEPIDALIQEARAHVELGHADADPLTANGWSADDTSAMNSLTDELDTGAAEAATRTKRRSGSPARSTSRSTASRRSSASCETRFPVPFATRPWRA